MKSGVRHFGTFNSCSYHTPRMLIAFTPEQFERCVFIGVILFSLLLTQNKFHTLLSCFHSWSLTSKYWLGSTSIHIHWGRGVRVRIRGLEMLVFWNILRTYLMDGPLVFVYILTRQSVHYPILRQCSISISPEKVMKQNIF